MNFTFLHKLGNKQFQVHRIMDVNTYRRLFRITDRDKPYELYVRYYDPDKLHTSNMIFMPGFIGTNSKTKTQDYYFRFKTEEECITEKNNIEKKKTILQTDAEIIKKIITERYGF